MKLLSSVSLLVLAFPFLTTSVFADIKCDPAGNQMQMNQCAFDDFSKVDKELNQLWKTLMKQLKGDELHTKQLRTAQRAWITFRDAEMEARFPCKDENKRFCWGSMYPLLYHGAMSDLTEDRIKQLKEHLPQDGASVEGGNNDVQITSNSFFGMSIGDKIAQYASKLKKGVLVTGEADFDVYYIKQGAETLGHIFPDPTKTGTIGTITVTSSVGSTAKGIKVGSTWSDVKKLLPGIKVHGSEIEGWTHAISDDVAYKLDIYRNDQNIDPSTIDAGVKVIEISLR